jgi:hypothetical protein
MGEMAFGGCGSLRWICIPAAVTTMTGLTFWSWQGMTLEIDPANRVFGVDGCFIVNRERNSLVRYVGTSGDVSIAKGFDQIDTGCFSTRRDIPSVTFEAGSRMSVLGVGAFLSCYGLKSIHIICTVEIICDHCFDFCLRLETVIFDSGSRISVIGDEAFARCPSLQSICLPSSVATIGAGCFLRCEKLSTVSLESDSHLSVVGHGAFRGCPSSLHLPPRLVDCLVQ